jgi:dihydrofolate synthase/folylpolyglutamate synthase
VNYAEAVAFLDGLTNYEKAGGYRYDDKNYGLERMRRLLAELGGPHEHIRSVIIAGTKGKGSTAAMLAAILAASGRRTGLYTSPHLVEYRERIRIDMEPVSGEQFAELAGGIVEPVERLARDGAIMRPTAFEALTAMALTGFAKHGVLDAVLEVGMGGRLDAVNVVDPAAIGITPISLDHTDQLGTTIGAIAGEKAGVIRTTAPVVAGPQPDDALRVIETACRAAGAPLLVVGTDVVAENVELSTEGARFDARTPGGRLSGLEIKLAGRHQVDNALAALGLALTLDVPETAIRGGLELARWPGRLQLWKAEPRILLDGAHNGASAHALAGAIRTIYRPRRLGLVLGMLRDKDHAAVVNALCPLAERVYLPVLRHPRALPPGELAAIIRPVVSRVCLPMDTATAVAAAGREFAGEGNIVLVAGSLSLVGEVMAAGR